MKLSGKNILRMISVSLAAMLFLTSCGSTTDNGNEDTTAENGTAPDTTTEEVQPELPERNFEGYNFNILNGNVYSWFTVSNVTSEEENGDTMNDAIYRRNRKVEELFNVKLDVREAAIDDLAGLVRTSVMAGDQSYDAAYIKGDHLNGIITDGCVLDLANVDGLNLDKPWWNQNVRNSCKLGKDRVLYFAVSDLSLTAFDLTWCLMFNETKLEKLNLDKP